MSADPFYLVKEFDAPLPPLFPSLFPSQMTSYRREIERTLEGIEGLFRQWEKLLAEAPGSADFRAAGDAVLQRLADVEWDFGDLARTVATVEQNRGRFRIGDAELAQRQQFIAATRARIDGLRTAIQSPDTQRRAEQNARNVYPSPPHSQPISPALYHHMHVRSC